MISRNDVKTYCEIVFADPAPGEFIALRGLPETGKTGRPMLSWIASARQRVVVSVQDFVERCDELGLAAYCLPGFVARYGGASNADVCGFSTVCADFDSGDIDANVGRAVVVLGNPSFIVYSGGEVEARDVDGHRYTQRKRHVYWTVTGEGRTVERMVALRAAIAACFGGDMSFARPMQIIRIAGSVHRKGDPKPVSVAYADPAATINLAQSEVRMRAIAPPPREGAAPAANNALGFARKVSLDALPMMSIGHGNADISRFEALTRMAGSMISCLHNVDDRAECQRDFESYVAWCRSKIENVERDYDLAQHWYRLLARERAKREWKKRQPRRNPAKRYRR